MFEKEAEEIANKRCHEIMCYGHCSFSSPKHHRCGEWHREYNCAKDGIEFGYKTAHEEMDYLNQHWKNEEEKKANEWHNLFKETKPHAWDYYDVPQDNLPEKDDFYYVKLKNGFIKICKLDYDRWAKKRYFYDLHGGKQPNVQYWFEGPKE